MFRIVLVTACLYIPWIAAGQTISFAPAAEYDAGTIPSSLHIADINGDGYPDVVVSSPLPALGRVVVLFDDGAGGFGEPVPHGASARGALAVGDLDGDGDEDIMACSLDGNFWYENDGHGALTEHRLPDAYATGRFATIGVSLLDYDRDGRTDIGLVTQLGDIEYSRSLGFGVFSEFHRRHLFDTAPQNIFNWVTSIDAVDLNGDDSPEFVVASHAPRTFVRLNWTRNRLEPEVMHDVGRVDSIAWGELDGNPGVDALFVHDAPNPNSVGVGVWIDCNDGTGNLTNCQRIRGVLGIGSPEAVAIGDFDSDGTNEIAIADTDHSLTVVIARRVSSGQWESIYRADLGDGANTLLAADLNQDGKHDLVALVSTGRVAVLMNDSP